MSGLNPSIYSSTGAHEEWPGAEMSTTDDVISAHAFCINNEPMLRNDKKCGCFYCTRIFNPSEIKEWILDEQLTALCPCCGIDSVIGESADYPLTEEFLSKMRDHWFSP